jgi:hypothetical protein
VLLVIARHDNNNNTLDTVTIAVIRGLRQLTSQPELAKVFLPCHPVISLCPLSEALWQGTPQGFT